MPDSWLPAISRRSMRRAVGIFLSVPLKDAIRCA